MQLAQMESGQHETRSIQLKSGAPLLALVADSVEDTPELQPNQAQGRCGKVVIRRGPFCTLSKKSTKYQYQTSDSDHSSGTPFPKKTSKDSRPSGHGREVSLISERPQDQLAFDASLKM